MLPVFLSSAVTGGAKPPRAPRNKTAAMAFIRLTSGRTITSAGDDLYSVATFDRSTNSAGRAVGDLDHGCARRGSGSRSLRQCVDRLSGQRFGCGRDDAIRRMKAQGLALPVRNPAAGTFDDRNERKVVVRLQSRLDDEVAMPGSDEAIRVAVAAEASEPCLAAHCLVTQAFIAAE